MRCTLAICLGLGLGLAGTAHAQFAGSTRAPSPASPPLVMRGGGDPVTGRDVADVREQIDRGRRAGTLSRREARALRREAGVIGSLSDRYACDGTSEAERRELDMRTRVLRDQTNNQRLKGAVK